MSHPRSQKPKLGTWVTVCHPTVVEIMASLPLDWVCVDLEHSPTSPLDMQTAIAIIQGKGKEAYVRVRQNTHADMKFPLDAGVDGMIVPMVNSASEAEAAVANAFYPPIGSRGAGLARAHKFGLDFASHLQKNLKDFKLIVQIEHYRAVEQIEAILKIEKVSGVFIGPYDLSSSFNLPGQLDHPTVLKAIAEVEQATKKAGKWLGAHVIAPEAKALSSFAGRGYDFLAFSLDTLFLARKANDELNAFLETFA